MDMLEMNKGVIEEFRANDGVCTGWLDGAPVVLVTMTGAKSGRTLCSPLVYSTDGDDIIIIASKGGAPEHPNWYFNLVANGAVNMEVAIADDNGNSIEEWEGTAHLIEDEAERKRVYAAQAALMDNFNDYEKSATEAGRVIPVFRVTRNG